MKERERKNETNKQTKKERKKEKQKNKQTNKQTNKDTCNQKENTNRRLIGWSHFVVVIFCFFGSSITMSTNYLSADLLRVAANLSVLGIIISQLFLVSSLSSGCFR